MIGTLIATTLALVPTPAPALRSALVKSAAAISTVGLPLAAHAEGEGINGAFKAAVADALGPQLADAAPTIGIVVFLGIYAFQTGVFSGGAKEEAPPAEAPPAAEEPPAEE